MRGPKRYSRRKLPFDRRCADQSRESTPGHNTRRTVVAALQGVSDSDAEHLAAAFDIKTVKDLGTNKYFLWAQAVTKLAE
ncbi:hypothetical protein ACNJ7E_31455 [Rhodococcus sp. NM-2]|uniref:hypothetical protein n=1 Tax=Rhodococcus TaxID=1827 RepID=UPI003AADAA54